MVPFRNIVAVWNIPERGDLVRKSPAWKSMMYLKVIIRVC